MPQNFYNLPPSWDPGYVIPDYVMAEPPGRGTFTTQWLPRGTISGMVPDFAAVKTARQILGRNDAGLGSLGDDTLGVGVGGAMRSLGANPIESYGQRAASWLMHSIKSVPSAQRSASLRAVFDAIDPSLWGKVEQRANDLRGRGMAAPQALQAAMAQEMSAGMLAELVATGKRAMRGDRAPVARQGQLALGVYPDAVPQATVYALEALGGLWGDIKTAAGKVVRGVTGAGKGAAGFVEKGIKTLGNLACKVVTGSGVGGSQAIGAGAAAGPIGIAAGAGVAAASAVCKKPVAEAAPPAPAPKGTPKWVLPVAIAGGAVVVGAIVLSTRKRK
jgi:hypothetical protein